MPCFWNRDIGEVQPSVDVALAAREQKEPASVSPSVVGSSPFISYGFCSPSLQFGVASNSPNICSGVVI